TCSAKGEKNPELGTRNSEPVLRFRLLFGDEVEGADLGDFGGVNYSDNFSERRLAVGFDHDLALRVVLYFGGEFALQPVQRHRPIADEEVGEIGGDLDDERLVLGSTGFGFLRLRQVQFEGRLDLLGGGGDHEKDKHHEQHVDQ